MCCYSLNALAVLIQKILGLGGGERWKKKIHNKINNGI